MTADFDITSILAFQPPSYVCPACRGLFSRFASRREGNVYVCSCPACEVDFLYPDWDDTRQSIHTMFRNGGFRLGTGDMFAHARALATVVETSRQGDTPWEPRPWPTMRVLLEMLARAKLFVHFTSWGISHLLIGALKATSMRVPVYGFVSNVEAPARAELTEYPDEAPHLTAKVIPSSQGIYDAPHQKLVVVDGLVAFKGSTNLTNAGMRRADRALDVTEIETNVGKVAELNNRYFAPVWKRLTAPGETFTMDWAPF